VRELPLLGGAPVPVFQEFLLDLATFSAQDIRCWAKREHQHDLKLRV